jgi:DNA repair exonuclease SbcCD ATPase subunit
MFGLGSAIKIISVLIIVMLVFGGVWHISNLKADLAIAGENAKKYEQAIQDQQAVVEQMKQDFAQINQINEDLSGKLKAAQADMNSLRDRFARSSSGATRDFGGLAESKPALIEKIINAGTINALRCMEIASGAPLTEQEKNATKPSEINKECPSIANPSYQPILGN